MRPLLAVIGLTLAAMPLAPTARAQDADVRQQLVARGAPADFADRVAEIVASARADGLPTVSLASKALEGWAKRSRVPPERVLSVLQGLSDRLHAGRDATATAGLDPAPGAVVAAAAEALGRGMTPEDVRAVIQSAPAPDAAATGLTVAASLAAQGLETAAAVKAVRAAYARGQAPEDVLELPSAVAGFITQGVRMSDVARRILEGGGLSLPAGPGTGAAKGRPPEVPPGRGRSRRP